VVEEAEWAAGAEIIREGEAGDMLFILERGACSAEKSIEGERKRVKKYAAGDFFGELALLGDQPRQASVVAATACVTLAVRRQAFTRLVGRCDSILRRNQRLYEETTGRLAEEVAAAAAATAATAAVAEARTSSDNQDF
jgi:CRP-like cAMP-binding protein